MERTGTSRSCPSPGQMSKRTRRYRPQTNAKVERCNRTLLEEWAYARLYHSNTQRRRAFAR
jgi:transposase InsO family protein